MQTLITEHWAGQVRGTGKNEGTRVVPVAPVVRSDLRTLFEKAYPAFVDGCRAAEEPGLALIAVDEKTGAPMGMACLRARVDRYVTAIIGRHDKCDLYLEGNDRLALRQLAVVVAPVRNWSAGVADISFQILDLRTAEGMLDEEGRSLHGLRSEGPAMVRCGGYAIFALPLGDPTDWPASASDAWECMPERVYHDELPHAPDGSVMRKISAAPHTQILMRTAGPRHTAMQLATDRDLAGQVVVHSSARRVAMDVGHQALREGLLIGRYERCASFGASDSSLSRAHALLLLVDDRMLAIDLASTNGTRQVGRPDARVIEIVGESELELGVTTFLTWTWSS